MMNIAMAKVVVGMVGSSRSAGPERDADDAELARAGMAAASRGLPRGWVGDLWQRMRGRMAPAAGARTADAALAATAIAVAQGVISPQTDLTEGLGLDRGSIIDRARAV